MNKFIKSYIEDKYGIDVANASLQDLSQITEIAVSDVTMSHQYGEWDFSPFPKLRKIDCSYNPITKLNVSANPQLEEISVQGARGDIPHPLDFSGNPHLRKVSAGQDGVAEFDFSFNLELENLSIFLSTSVRWLNVDNCKNLKRVDMQGANIPFVDLTHCHNLEWVRINYWNLYRNKYDEYGPGYPRPFVFVTENFDESIMDDESRRYKDYTYFLIRVSPKSPQEKFLHKLKSMKPYFISIPQDRYGHRIAITHYELLDIYKDLLSED